MSPFARLQPDSVVNAHPLVLRLLVNELPRRTTDLVFTPFHPHHAYGAVLVVFGSAEHRCRCPDLGDDAVGPRRRPCSDPSFHPASGDQPGSEPLDPIPAAAAFVSVYLVTPSPVAPSNAFLHPRVEWSFP